MIVHYTGASWKKSLALIAWCMCLAGRAFCANLLLFDFEDGTQGWEHETDGTITPDAAETVADNARHGKAALVFNHHFSKASRLLHCRVTSGFPRDVTTIAGFHGFSAWVFIPNGSPYWEAKMFVRSGSDWKWSEGKARRGLEPGWYRVEIPRDKIVEPNLIKDLGVEVVNFTDDIESRIRVDQVEAVLTGPAADSPAE
ncbi:MAG: hypothetical protein V1873_04985 [Verrucomicrobiota bacterium]